MRYEIKMVCQEHAYPAVMTHLRTLPFPVRALHPRRHVQSIYCDTCEQGSLADNLDGISHRAKLRFRWYGHDSESVNGQLEYKTRINQLGDKEVCPIGQAMEVDGASKTSFVRRLRAAAQARWRARLDLKPLPVQWIRYDREYLASHGGRVRITVDTHLQAFDLRLSPILSCRFPTPLPRLLVVEFKAEMEHHAALSELADHCRLKSDRCSKFAIACSRVSLPSVAVFPV